MSCIQASRIHHTLYARGEPEAELQITTKSSLFLDALQLTDLCKIKPFWWPFYCFRRLRNSGYFSWPRREGIGLFDRFRLVRPEARGFRATNLAQAIMRTFVSSPNNNNNDDDDDNG